MAHITKIEFNKPQGVGQQGLHGMMHAAMKMMKHLQAKGQSVKVHYDDGSVVDYVPAGAADNTAGGLEITMTPGVV